MLNDNSTTCEETSVGYSCFRVGCKSSEVSNTLTGTVHDYSK